MGLLDTPFVLRWPALQSWVPRLPLCHSVIPHGGIPAECPSSRKGTWIVTLTQPYHDVVSGGELAVLIQAHRREARRPVRPEDIVFQDPGDVNGGQIVLYLEKASTTRTLSLIDAHLPAQPHHAIPHRDRIVAAVYLVLEGEARAGTKGYIASVQQDVLHEAALQAVILDAVVVHFREMHPT